MQIVETPKREVNLGIRSAIESIQKKIQSLPDSLGEDPFPLKHSFAEGLYIREIFIPKGYYVVGKLHKDSYFNSILSGEVSVLTEEGSKRIKAPATIISPAGSKRFGFVHEDTVWVTVHANPTNERDLDKLEDMIHTKDYSEVNKGEEVESIEFDEFAIGISGFDAEHFRKLTKEIYDHEKPGFWSDWTEGQRDVYMTGDWEAFSRLRGYSEDEIDTLREWIEVKENAEAHGINPLSYVLDLIEEVINRNIKLDVNGEIMKSSHMPSSKKEPYSRRELCQEL